MTSTEHSGFLNLSGINKSFNGYRALKDIDLTVSAGESVCFLGPSGCGKTTLLRLIAGLEMPDSGQISLNGQDISYASPRSRNFGMVFQSYSLFPHLSVAKNVAYGLRCRKWARAKIHSRVQEMLALVQLAEHANKLPHALSGGQQQRVAIARALAPEPYVLLLDEPFSALDARVRGQLREEMRELQRRLGITTILVTHDQEEAMAVADRIVVMKDGRIEQIGSGAEVYHQPQTRFVAGFVGNMNLLRVQRGADGGLILGQQPLMIGEPVVADCHLVGIRPEAVTLAADDGVANSFPATVVKSQFLGKQTRLEILLDEQLISLELYGRRDETLTPGHLLNVFLPPHEIRQMDAR